jgi:CRISPR-associated endoribonuclease Cas6
MYGMEVDEVKVAKTPSFKSEQRFLVASPVLIRKNEDPNHRKHLTYSDEEVDQYLSRTVNRKMKEAGFDNDQLEIAFDRTYQNPKTKLVNLKGTELRANFCPVIIKGRSQIHRICLDGWSG